MANRWLWVMVFNVTFNNISFISWRSVLVVEDIPVYPEKSNNLPRVTDTVYHIVLYRVHIVTLVVICTDCKGSSQEQYDHDHDGPKWPNEKKDKRQTMIHKALHRKLKNEQHVHNFHKKTSDELGCPGRETSPCFTSGTCRIIVKWNDHHLNRKSSWTLNSMRKYAQIT